MVERTVTVTLTLEEARDLHRVVLSVLGTTTFQTPREIAYRKLRAAIEQAEREDDDA